MSEVTSIRAEALQGANSGITIYTTRHTTDEVQHFVEASLEASLNHLHRLHRVTDQARLKTDVEIDGVHYFGKATFVEPRDVRVDYELQNQHYLTDVAAIYNSEHAASGISLQVQPIEYVTYFEADYVAEHLPELIDDETAGRILVVSYAPFIDGLRYQDLLPAQQTEVRTRLNTMRQFFGAHGAIPLDFDLGQLHYQVGEDGAIIAHIIDYEEWDITDPAAQ